MRSSLANFSPHLFILTLRAFILTEEFTNFSFHIGRFEDKSTLSNAIFNFYKKSFESEWVNTNDAIFALNRE